MGWLSKVPGVEATVRVVCKQGLQERLAQHKRKFEIASVKFVMPDDLFGELRVFNPPWFTGDVSKEGRTAEVSFTGSWLLLVDELPAQDEIVALVRKAIELRKFLFSTVYTEVIDWFLATPEAVLEHTDRIITPEHLVSKFTGKLAPFEEKALLNHANIVHDSNHRGDEIYRVDRERKKALREAKEAAEAGKPNPALLTDFFGYTGQLMHESPLTPLWASPHDPSKDIQLLRSILFECNRILDSGPSFLPPTDDKDAALAAQCMRGAAAYAALANKLGLMDKNIFKRALAASKKVP